MSVGMFVYVLQGSMLYIQLSIFFSSTLFLQQRAALVSLSYWRFSLIWYVTHSVVLTSELFSTVDLCCPLDSGSFCAQCRQFCFCGFLSFEKFSGDFFHAMLC